MKLVHYSRLPITKLKRLRNDARDLFKPRGLWVSDDDCEDNWHAWCESEGFRLDCLTHAHDVELKNNASIVILTSAHDIDSFSQEFCFKNKTPMWPFSLRWPAVTKKWQGIIITPYIWERRMFEGNTDWYCGWDCASGCIWDPTAIASISLRQVNVLETSL